MPSWTSARPGGPGRAAHKAGAGWPTGPSIPAPARRRRRRSTPKRPLAAAYAKHHLLYQLPTGGGKTVIFSEIVRRYLSQHNKKVVVLTHRIELCKQTSKMLKGFDVKNKIINSKVKELQTRMTFLVLWRW